MVGYCGAAVGYFWDHAEQRSKIAHDLIARDIPGTFVFDSYFTNAEILNPLHARKRDYVGDLKFNRKVVWNGREMSADEMAASIPFADRRLVETDGKKQRSTGGAFPGTSGTTANIGRFSG